MNEDTNQIPLGDECFLDLRQQEIVKGHCRIALTLIQTRLLYYLANHVKQAVTTEELIRYAWGEEVCISRDKLYVQINLLRSYLEDDPKNPELLISLRGLGYMLFPRRI